MLRLLPRFLLVFVTLATMVVAVFQGVGRLSFMALQELEPAVNEVLDDQQIRVTGLSGDWRLLNPIVKIDRLDLPAGQVSDVFFELDAVRTVLFSRLVAKRLRVGNLDLALEKPDDGPWRLMGARDAVGFDVLRFVRESAQLELNGSLAFHRPAYPVGSVRLAYLGINRGGEHRHRLKAWNGGKDCASPCQVRLDYHAKEGIWPLRGAQQRMTASARNFTVPRVLLAVSGLRFETLDLSWQREDDLSGGMLALDAAQVGLPAGSALSTELRGAVRGVADDHQGSLNYWRIDRGERTWTLPEIALRGDGEVVQAWLEGLDLGIAGEFLESALSGLKPAARWLGALDVRGQAHNVRAYLRLPSLQWGYAATLDGIAMEGFKGAPYVRSGAGELLGYARGMELNLNAHEVALQFPDLFKDRWSLPYAQGRVQAWFGPGYFGLRGTSIRAGTGVSRAAGGFSLSRPAEKTRQSLTLMLNVDGVDVDHARQFVPYKLPRGLLDWVATAPREGYISNARVAYQGQLKVEPGELGRRLALSGDVRGARVRYHPDWPEVRSLNGHVAVSGSTVTVAVDEAESAGVLLSGSRVTLTDNGTAADIALEADLDAGAALDFARYTPLQTWITFLQPDWTAAGPMVLEGDLHIPLTRLDGQSAAADEVPAPPPPGQSPPDDISVRVRADLREVDVNLPGYGLSFADLAGILRYRYPYGVEAEGITGELFGEPVELGAATRDQSVHLLLSGQAAPADVWALANVADPGIARGSFSYEADLGIGTAPGGVTQLKVNADLAGLAVDLPGPFAKTVEESLPLSLSLQFLPDYMVLRGRYRDASGWLHFADAPLRGAVGFGVPAPTVAPGLELLVLSGHVPYFALDEVLPGEGAGGASLPLPLRLQNLTADEIRVGDFAITTARVDGRVRAGEFDLTLASDNVSGTFEQGQEGPLSVTLREFVVPVADSFSIPDGMPIPGDEPATTAEAPEDPLDPAIIEDLPAADVVVNRLMVGGADYGSWSFSMQPRDGALQITGLAAEVRGVKIDAPEGLTWRADTNDTRFSGALRADNLVDVLPQWGYAPQMQTREASLTGSFTWPGSPAAVEMLNLKGEAKVRAEDGYFLEVESAGGTLAIFSLLNFTAIAKRMSLDFSDVSGKGVSFDRLRARFLLDNGTLTFLEPMEVDGTGSNFRVAGSVNLKTGALENEMIVTLPVSKSLPWYGAYIALANPIAGLGVLVGERVLRKPLEQFSSARYEIGGTLEDPQVKLVGVFDTQMSEKASGTEPAANPDGAPEAISDPASETRPPAGAESAGAPFPALGTAGSATGQQPEQSAATVTDE